MIQLYLKDIEVKGVDIKLIKQFENYIDRWLYVIMDIEFKEKLDESVASWLDGEFEKYANKNSLLCNYKTFNFLAKENDKIIGILNGYSVYDEKIYIELLFVLEEYRKRGIGSKLIKRVENYYCNKNFSYISLVTCGFQAPDFYEKRGFKLEFKRENKINPKLTRYFFIKYF